MKRIFALILTALMLVSLAACGKDAPTPSANEAKTETQPAVAETPVSAGEGEVKGTGETLVIYSNSASDGRGDWLVERAAQDGFNLQYVDLGAGDCQARLIAEKAAPIADVVYGLNGMIWASLKAEGVLTPYVPMWADEVDANLNDPDGFYHCIVKQAILLCYNQDKMTAEEAPSDWPDLWNKEEYHGRYEFLTGLGGGTVRTVLAGILTRYADPNGELGVSEEGWAEIAKYYQYGSPNESGVDLYARMADPESPVCLGQMWSSGVEGRDEQYGVNSGYVVPEIGVPFVVEGVAIVNGTKKQEEAQRFVDWFGTGKIQGEWAEQFSTLPANVNAVDKANEFNQEMAQLKAQPIDWDLVAANIDGWTEKIMLEYMP